MAWVGKRACSRWYLVLSLCLFVFLFSLQTRLELYGRGLQEPVHPCNSSKLCLDAHAPKVTLSRTVRERISVSPERRPTLRTEPLAEGTLVVPVPLEMSLPYQRRLHRSPPLS